MHYKLGHHPMGGKFFRNHINFHHNFYSKDHLVSQTYLGDEGSAPFGYANPVVGTRLNAGDQLLCGRALPSDFNH